MTISDFADYFLQLHGRSPFPWQVRLARRVCKYGWGSEADPGNENEGRTDFLALPTSAGKTAVIDIAVFNLALEAGLPADKRKAARRIFFVIDRRIVVDEAFRRACHIASKLRGSTNGVLSEIANRLKHLAGNGDAEPLVVAMMRGGMYRDDGWAASPVQPTVCVSTVDQVGSRLLFRGYGLSEYQRPVHAGLIGSDSLIVLDEAHISNPFVETLAAVRRYSGKDWAAEPSVVRPLQVVQMTATPPPGTTAFSIDDADRRNAVLSVRLAASKRARLVEVQTQIAAKSTPRSQQRDIEARNATAFAEEVVRHAKRFADTEKAGETAPTGVPPPRVIGVIVNRVAAARHIFSQLQNLQDEKGQPLCHAILLTGRIRPYDRDELLNHSEVDGRPIGWLRFIKADRSASDTLDKPLFVVSTQTVEVGADVSFDALVTEVASIDALRQRFGRLDRLGNRKVSQAVILARKDKATANAQDVVYGEALHPTWKQLQLWAKGKGKGTSKVTEIDLGIEALQPQIDELKLSDPEAFRAMCAPLKRAPVMLPAHMDVLCQTSPAPACQPEVALFLHGPNSGPPDVQLVWRADLPDELNPQHQDDYIATVNLVPPTTIEALAVPIYDVQSWLAERTAAESLVDVEGAGVGGQGETHRKGRERSTLVLRWCGPEDKRTRVITAAEIRPGDTIAVPASYGGCDKFGWDPESTTVVRDVADPSARLARWRPALRLHAKAIMAWRWPARPEAAGELRDFEKELVDLLSCETQDEEARPDFQPIIAKLRDDPRAPAWVKQVVTELATPPCRRIPVPYSDGSGWLLEGRRRLAREQIMQPGVEPEAAGMVTNEDNASSMIGHEVGITEHHWAVGDRAREYGAAVGLPSPTIEDLAVAGTLHDVGKADPRFQVWLHDGDELAAATAGRLLAKSGKTARNAAAIRRARELAGYPEGGRHECLSASMILASPQAIPAGRNRDLIIYLIGTHHGRGRAFMPVVPDSTPEVAEFERDGQMLRALCDHRMFHLGAAWTDLFWAMVRNYGYWGLAYLEAILRLADCGVSQEEQTEG